MDNAGCEAQQAGYENPQDCRRVCDGLKCLCPWGPVSGANSFWQVAPGEPEKEDPPCTIQVGDQYTEQLLPQKVGQASMITLTLFNNMCLCYYG